MNGKKREVSKKGKTRAQRFWGIRAGATAVVRVSMVPVTWLAAGFTRVQWLQGAVCIGRFISGSWGVGGVVMMMAMVVAAAAAVVVGLSDGCF